MACGEKGTDVVKRAQCLAAREECAGTAGSAVVSAALLGVMASDTGRFPPSGRRLILAGSVDFSVRRAVGVVVLAAAPDAG